MPKGPKIVAETDKKVSAVCQNALSKVQNAVLHHYQAHPDSAWSGHYLVDLEKTIKEIYKDMGIDIGGLFKVGLSKQMQDFYNKAAKDMQKMGKRNAILGKPDVGLVKQYLNSSFEEIAMRTTKMSFDHVRALRGMAGDVLRTASLTGASMKDVTKEFLARAQEIPGFKFTAANGAQWSNESYFRMLARTEMMNAGRAAYDAKCAKEGVDLVELSVSGHCCEACAEYEGTVFSLTGATPGYPTKQDLIDAGVFHPNCTHSYTAVPNWNLPDAEGEEPEKKQEEEPEAKKAAEPEEKPAPAPKAAPEPEQAPEPVKQPEPVPAPVINAEPQPEPEQAPVVTPAPEPETPPVDSEQADAEQKAKEAEQAKKEAEEKKIKIALDLKKATEEAERAKKEAEEAARRAREEEERLERVAEELRQKQEAEKKAKEEAKKVAKKKEAGFPESVDGLRFIKELGGTTHAKLFEDEYGNKFVMKRGGGAGGEPEAHLRNEFAADSFYRAVGINVPEGKIYETPDGPVKLTRYIEGKSLDDWWYSATKAEREEMKQKLRLGFGADVLTGNWDVIGESRDNILVDKNGKPWRIDNGGAFGFRAQGARKEDAAWKEGWPEDVWSMRTSKNNKEFFGDINTLDLLNEIADKNWSKALKNMPEEDRKVVEKRLAEIKELAVRGNAFKKDYTPEAIDVVVHSSMEMKVDGLPNKIPDDIKKSGKLPTDFKWFRTSYSSASSSDIDKKNTDISDKVIAAVKTLNKHNSFGSDHTPNKKTLKEAYKLMPELKKMAKSGNNGAAYYLHRLEQIKAAENAGEQIGTFIDSSVTVYSPTKPQKVDSFSSFTAYMHDYISKQSVEYNGSKIQLDPMFIATSQRAQGHDSYDEIACRMKVVRLKAEGIDVKDVKQIYYNGDTFQEEHFKDAVDYYNRHPDILARDEKTYLMYQAGIQHLFENCDFAYNDKKTRTIILARTVPRDVTGNSTEGELLPADVKQGINESHSCFTAVKINDYVDRDLTLARVPWNRISGCWMGEKEPGSVDCGYYKDSENEICADTHGLQVMVAKLNVKQGEPLKDYIELFKKREKEGFN